MTPPFLLRAMFAGLVLAPAGGHASVADDTADPVRLIDAYHQAVVSHDGARLTQLFVPHGSAWFSALSDRELAHARASKPDAPKVRPGSVADFVSFVSSSKAALDPQHTNRHITTDGTIATVTFDFRFMIDGKEENRGAESWQIIKGESGWRIVSIIFSSSPTRPKK